MPKEQKMLLLTTAYKRARSFTVAMSALRFLVEYGRLCDRVGHAVVIEEYAIDVGLSRSQAFRRQAAFRTCFPKDDLQEMWRIVQPILDASNFANEHPRAQAVFVGTIKVTLTTP